MATVIRYRDVPRRVKRSAPGYGGATIKTSAESCAEFTHTGLHRAQVHTMTPRPSDSKEQSEASRENIVTSAGRSCPDPICYLVLC